MAIDSDTAAITLVDSWERLSSSHPDWWSQRERGAVAGVTRVPLPTLNGVVVSDLDADPDVVDALLDRVAATDLPYCLQVRPGWAPVAERIAFRRGMTAEAIPLMVLDGPGHLMTIRPPELRIRVLSPEERHVHVACSAAGFEEPEEYFDGLITPEMVRMPGMNMYLGEVDGEPVTTGVGFTVGDSVGIFNIATPAAHRGRGYGSAVTAAAIRGGLAGGATWAWLQSSPLGLPVYEKIGFRTAESWSCWLKPA